MRNARVLSLIHRVGLGRRGPRLSATRAFAFAMALSTACSSGDKVDKGFDTRVSKPTYTSEGPRVLFDQAHHNAHRARESYKPFVEMIESDGYRVSTNKKPITTQVLEPYAVFVVAAAAGTNERNDDPAFTVSECNAIRDWVHGGGALLLVTDHYPFGIAVERLAVSFGVQLSKGSVEDSLNYDPAFEPTHIVFSAENGGLPDHPIIAGRNVSERVTRVLTFTGEAVYADPPAVGFLKLSPTALARDAEPKVEKSGGDVRVFVTYGDPVAVPGWSQGVALEFGTGRVVVLGEAAMLSARFQRFDGKPIGMNTPGYDNRRLALNIMHWLTRAI